MSDSKIGPGELSKKDSPFLLKKSEWYSVQRYVNDGVMLPDTNEKFKESLGGAAPGDLNDFAPLISAYKDIKENCSDWRDNIYPESVSLASDIYDYGKNLAPVYYPPINDLADILDLDPENERAKKKLKALLQKLTEEAETRANKAAVVAEKVKVFANKTQDSKSVLTGSDGNGGLNKKYEDKYGTTSTEVQSMQKEIEDLSAIVKQLTESYEHEVTVAATTPTYAWLFPIGTIAGVVVAGVYGDKAVKTMDRIKSTQKKIESLNSSLRSRINLLATLTITDQGLDDTVAKINEALPVIQKIQGIWGAISADIQNIVDMIDSNIAQVPPMLKSFGVDAAVEAWKNVAEEANNYRVNAYVTIES